ncbi:chromosome segregation protein SMC [Lacticaseibacillus suihuaensis]
MQLTHLTISGFKSFADKTEIAFVPGLTGIVGPNGSGKSNITEAIRWALGEQSAKSLRGEKMGDVIFAGTAQRAALNRAEVIMTFDNADGYLKDQPATVTVCRRLYRDGESDFLINNRNVRLKDIVDLFMDSGLGKESFSFISQGRVEAIFNSKPKDRRGIIEEAAGVLKYKQQKEKAEQKLQETDDNLDRANDIVTELSRQVTPLAEQASLARDFERQNADYQTVHKSILALEIQQMAAEQTQVQAQSQVTKQTLNALADQLKHLEAKSETLTQGDNDFEAQLTTVNDQLLSQSMRLENLNGEVKLSAERASNAQATLAELKQQLAAAAEQQTAAQKQVTELTATQQAQAKDYQRLQAQAAAQADSAASPQALNTELEAAQTRYIDLLQQQATVKNQLSSAEKDAQLAASQNQAENQRRQALAGQVQDQKAVVDDLLAQHQAALAAVAAAKAQATEAEQAAATAQADYADESERLTAATSIYQRANARYETLQELRDDYAGFYAGVRAVLKQKAALPGVIGAVAELLAVPSQYQQALDVALGGSLQAVVTTTEQAAKQGITYLKRTKSGRATFLPTAVVRPRLLPANVLAQLQGQPGFIGIGVDLVRFREEVRPVMANLLGSLIVATTLDDGIRLANLTGHRYRIVSLDGDILAPGGALTGGQTKKTGTSPLARTQEVTELHARLRDMTAALAKQRELVATKKAALTAAAAALAPARAAAEAAQTHLAEQAAQKQLQESALAQLKRQAEAAGLQAADGTDFEAAIARLQQQAKEVAAALEQTNQTVADLKARLSVATAAASQTQATQSQLATKLAVLKQAQATTKAALAQANQASTDATAKHKQLEERIAGITEAAATGQHAAGNAATIAALERKLADLHRTHDQLVKDKAANRDALSRVSAAITTAYTKQKAAMAESEQQGISLNRLKIHLNDHLATLADTYQLTFEAALEKTTAQAADLPVLKSRLKLLRRGLDELGPINPNAIAEYDNVKARYDFLTKQQTDLLEAKDMLLKTMGELDSEVATRFEDMFNKTNAAFTEIFPRMFGGGTAHLALTEPDDLLNTGIEISAQPPGKKLQRLSLLSGGERALTAIVLLFAILQVRPVPFSILDEVEASLDEVNVNRFGEFLKHYSSDTQFIVITHRRGTMLAANMLYGVTMQESGVSSMVAVSLDQLATDS